MQFLKRSSALSCEDDEAKIETVAVSSQVKSLSLRLKWLLSEHFPITAGSFTVGTDKRTHPVHAQK